MTIIEIINLIAIGLGPFFGIFAQSKITEIKQRRDRKEYIFKTLMATRATPLDVNHVQALNMIDLEFSSKNKKEKKVLISWKILMDHFSSFPQQSKNNQELHLAAIDSWNKENNDKLVDMLSEMASCLNYDFDKVHLKKGVYYPKGHGDIDAEQSMLRKAALMFFMGDKTVKVAISEETNTSRD